MVGNKRDGRGIVIIPNKSFYYGHFKASILKQKVDGLHGTYREIKNDGNNFLITKQED
jgi:hypothetical protein